MAEPSTVKPVEPQIPVQLQRKRGQRSRGLAQAMAIQDFTFEALMAIRAGLTSSEGKPPRVDRATAKAISDLCRANDAAQDRVRIHRGVPLPGSIRQVAAKPKKRQSAGLTPQPVVSCGVIIGPAEPKPIAAHVESATATA